MLKNILNLEGIQKLNKAEQKSVTGNGSFLGERECGTCEIRVIGGCENICL